jgi:hypothetical protein
VEETVHAEARVEADVVAYRDVAESGLLGGPDRRRGRRFAGRILEDVSTTGPANGHPADPRHGQLGWSVGQK